MDWASFRLVVGPRIGPRRLWGGGSPASAPTCARALSWLAPLARPALIRADIAGVCGVKGAKGVAGSR